MSATESEQKVYEWCTQKSKGSQEACILANVYISTYMDTAHLIRLSDLRSLPSTQREWALDLIQGYMAGWFTAPRERALELVALYGISIDTEEGV